MAGFPDAAHRHTGTGRHAAAPGSIGEPLVDAFVASLRARGARVETGIFGADMAVALVNDGPVTLVVDSAMWAS